MLGAASGGPEYACTQDDISLTICTTKLSLQSTGCQPSGCVKLISLVVVRMQAVKIMAAVCLIWGVMWCLGILPGQQDVADMEQRLMKAVQQKEQKLQQTAAHTASSSPAHNEL